MTDLSPAELVLAWHERHCPPLLETFARLCAEVAGEPQTVCDASAIGLDGVAG